MNSKPKRSLKDILKEAEEERLLQIRKTTRRRTKKKKKIGKESMYAKCLEENKRYRGVLDRSRLLMPPSKKLAVVVCMDAGLTVEDFLGLKTGDAHIIKNAGGIVTEDVLRSLIISYKLLGTKEFFVINHTGCGMLTFEDENLRKKLKKDTGHDTGVLQFYSFKNLRRNVRKQVKKIKECPFIPSSIPVYGFIYQVETGRLKEVK